MENEVKTVDAIKDVVLTKTEDANVSMFGNKDTFEHIQ